MHAWSAFICFHQKVSKILLEVKIPLDCCIICMSNLDIYQTCLKELKETQVERSLISTNHWSNGPALCDAMTQKTRMDKWFCTWQKITWRQELWQSVSLLDFWAQLMSSGNYESISLILLKPDSKEQISEGLKIYEPLMKRWMCSVSQICCERQRYRDVLHSKSLRQPNCENFLQLSWNFPFKVAQ